MSDWEGRGRRPVRGWATAAALALLVVAAGVALVRDRPGLPVEADLTPRPDATEDGDVVEALPLRPEDGGVCPVTHPVAVDDRTGRYYPAAFPRAEVPTPDLCLAHPEGAVADGYRLADPPPGTIRVAGIYLEPARSPSHDDCQVLADAAGFTVACPGRLPAPADGPSCRAAQCLFDSPESAEAGVVIRHELPPVPQDGRWSGAPRDVTLTAVRVAGRAADGTLRLAGPAEFVSCFPEAGVTPRGPRVLRTCVDARSWTPTTGGHPLERHTTAVWRRGNVVYGAGVLGAGRHVDAVLTAVIDSIEYVAPR